MGMSHTYMRELASDDSGNRSRAIQFRSDPKFHAVMKEMQSSRRYPHPKMDRLKMLLKQHLECGDITKKAMVFVTHRECVEEIVNMLDAEKPLIRATRFVGQGSDKQGKKGCDHKKQQEVGQHPFSLSSTNVVMQAIDRFKAGYINVLVATSVGEEGLDIGEIDLIVCYDAQKTPIRMVWFFQNGICRSHLLRCNALVERVASVMARFMYCSLKSERG